MIFGHVSLLVLIWIFVCRVFFPSSAFEVEGLAPVVAKMPKCIANCSILPVFRIDDFIRKTYYFQLCCNIKCNFINFGYSVVAKKAEEHSSVPICACAGVLVCGWGGRVAGAVCVCACSVVCCSGVAVCDVRGWCGVVCWCVWPVPPLLPSKGNLPFLPLLLRCFLILR
jgi:hypothetical protein